MIWMALNFKGATHRKIRIKSCVANQNETSQKEWKKFRHKCECICKYWNRAQCLPKTKQARRGKNTLHTHKNVKTNSEAEKKTQQTWSTKRGKKTAIRKWKQITRQLNDKSDKGTEQQQEPKINKNYNNNNVDEVTIGDIARLRQRMSEDEEKGNSENTAQMFNYSKLFDYDCGYMLISLYCRLH